MSTVELVADAVLDQLRHPLEQGRALASGLLAPTRLVRQAAVQLGGIAHYGAKMVRPESILNGPIGPHRRWGWARADLADVKKVKDAFGGTVNDVILAAITGAFRTFLQGRGDAVDGESIRTMVPVSTRMSHQKGTLGNQVSAIFADLPIGTADPVERLHAITAQLGDLKRRGAALGARTLLTAAEFVPPTLLALGSRAAARVPQRTFSTVTTNIPGPQQPLYLLGRQLTEMFPYIPLAIDLRITIGIFSYHGRLDIGVTGDYDAVPDLAALCTAIESSVAELVAAAEARQPA
jgi:WS/DGAT/MGAT family acyltransferase